MRGTSKRTIVILTVAAMVVAGVTVANGAARTRVPGARPSWARPSNLVRQVRPDSRVDFLVFLGWRDPAAVTAVARAVSDPSSPAYGHYLSASAFRARFSPTSSDVAAVRSWLSDSGLRVGAVPASRLWVAASGRASDVERALGTTLGMYRAGQTLRRAPSSDPFVPAALSGIVRGFVGLSDVRMQVGIGTRLPKPPAFKAGRPCSAYWGEKMADDKPPAYGATAPYTVCGYEPDQIRSAYGMSDAIAAGIDGTGQTVAVIDAFASPTIDRDLRKYSARHGLPAADLTQYNAPVTPGSDIGNQQGWWGEETLDLESIHGLAPGATLVYLGARDNSGRGLLERFEFAVDGELAQIISNSYGTAGEKIAPSGFAAWEAVFQQAAAMGIGSYFSSGDCGDNKDPDGLCGGTGLHHHGLLGLEPVGDLGRRHEPRASAIRASTCSRPAGERRRRTSGNNRWTPAPPGQYRYGSGGGTSGLFAEPAYQVGVVPDALATRWNGRNRVVPDVAAVGDPDHRASSSDRRRRSETVLAYAEYRIGGTSLSCPLFAAIMALADQAAGIHHGFANPALYTLAGSSRVPRHRGSGVADGSGSHGLRELRQPA